MSFLKLSNIIINTSKITSIQYSPTKYLVNLTSTHINGVILFGSGSISTEDGYLTICKEKTPEDFEVFTKWICDLDKN